MTKLRPIAVAVATAAVLATTGLTAGKQLLEWSWAASEDYVDLEVLKVAEPLANLQQSFDVSERRQIELGLQFFGVNIARVEIELLAYNRRDDPDGLRIKGILVNQLTGLRDAQRTAKCQLRRLDDPRNRC